MELKHIIFLDIDGVLAGYKFLCTGRGFIDPDKVALINQLKGAEIVISSSWGYDNGRTEKSLRECGLELPIIGYTDHVHFNFEWACRGNEIEKWLLEHAKGMGTQWGDEHLHKDYQEFDYEYVIFDDNDDMLLGQKDHFIKTSEEYGVNQEDIDLARKILKLKDEAEPPHVPYIYWIDDKRDPKDYLSDEDYGNTLWFKNYDGFKYTLHELGLPRMIYFDHDLGYGKTGYDCAKLLVEYCIEHDCDLPKYYCHSSNPSGKANIISYLDSYMKSRKI